MRGGGSGSVLGAVATERPGPVLQLTPVLHQVALLAYELGRLGRHDLLGDRLESLLPREGQDGVVVLVLLRRLRLLLDDQLLDGLYVALGGVLGRGGRRGRGGLIGLFGLGLLVLNDIFV